MRSISDRRQLVEDEGCIHAVKRGRRGWLHFENMPWLHKIFKLGLRVSALFPRGAANVLDLRVEEVEFSFDGLAEVFDGMRILFLSDMHIDEIDGLVERIIETVEPLSYDLCILGGDYTFHRTIESDVAYSRMQTLGRWLCQRSRVLGVLGNHDRYRMGEVLAECGVEMLINDSACVERSDEKIYIAGIDDCHYYGAHDLEAAGAGIEEGRFKIMASHSPEVYRQVARRGYSLELCGHTHGGQVCLPGAGAVVTNATVPRELVSGKWKHNDMQGYTSRGTGASGVAVRYFCPAEVSLITLSRLEKWTQEK